MLFPQKTPLILKRELEVSSRGENVILRIGNTDLPMHYEHALALSKWVRQESQAIKHGTGRGKAVRSLGIMHDAEAKAVPLPYQSGTAIHVKQRLHTYSRGDVTTQGRLVLIKIGHSTVSLHFETALKVSQWLRVRAKEARNRAGDTRHWSTIPPMEGDE